MWHVAPYILFLLRNDFIATQERSAWMKTHEPDLYYLDRRPSFDGSGKTDQYEFAWFLWHTRSPSRVEGKHRHLNTKAQDGQGELL